MYFQRNYSASEAWIIKLCCSWPHFILGIIISSHKFFFTNTTNHLPNECLEFSSKQMWALKNVNTVLGKAMHLEGPINLWAGKNVKWVATVMPRPIWIDLRVLIKHIWFYISLIKCNNNDSDYRNACEAEWCSRKCNN